jgi:fructosamine-3-kinase
VIPDTIAGRRVASAQRIAGGDINDAYAVTLEDGERVFVKTRDGVAPGEYATEAAGLRWLADGGARTPEVVEAADTHLALEWLERETADDQDLGRRLAEMHLAGAPRFGSLPPGGTKLRIGPLEFTGESDDWPSFLTDCLLRPLADRVGVEVPPIPQTADAPSRLHGDLWSGNVFGPYLIDPAAYGGHREVDLAMLHLFGTPSATLLAAYDEVYPREDGFEERLGLYQLFPLLVHAVLFGGGYVARARAVAQRYR